MQPVVSITVQGGLGNQMFQLAAAYAHARALNGGLQVRRTKAEYDGRPLYWSTALWQFQPFLTDEVPSALVWKEPHGATKYAPLPVLSNSVDLDGYFQSPKYFQHIPRAEVAALFAPRPAVVESVHEKCAALLRDRENVIVVHARRGDYCKNAGMIAFHGPLPVQYYVEALSRATDAAAADINAACCAAATAAAAAATTAAATATADAAAAAAEAATRCLAAATAKTTLLFVSDDNTFWTDEVFPALPTNVASLPRHVLEGLDEEETLYLMSQFKRFVIANSTFSWWGAWLSGTDPANVIAPVAWFGPTGLRDYEDIYEAGWTRI